ncbi:SH3 domain-containing C40 family peptidase [Helicobacter pylori]
MRSFFNLLLVSLFFFGCSEAKREKPKPIADLLMPQNALEYLPSTKVAPFSKHKLLELKENYLKKFFSPFLNLAPNPNISEVFWIKSSLEKNIGYGENLKPIDPKMTQKILQDMQLPLYPSVAQMAIVVKDSDVRAVPSVHPRFSKSSGFPFDRWQNSMIFYGTPVLITHFDKSKRFAHIQTEFVYGWVDVRHLAFVSPKQAKNLAAMKDFVVPKSDELIITDWRGDYLTQARIGKIFPLAQKNKIWVFKRQSDGKLRIEQTQIDPQAFDAFPLNFSQKKVAEYINELVGRQYGWGGMYEERDCSAFIRDIFTNFGLYLPRNSYAQGHYGTRQIDLSLLASNQKEQILFSNATPFGSVLYLKGHIMLYLGKDQKGRAVAAHSAWSVNAGDIWGKEEYRLGGVVITTLEPANEYNGNWGRSKTLRDRILLVNDLYSLMEDIGEGR